MLSEDLISSDRRCLGAIADAELGVKVTQLGLYGVLADVEVSAEFTIGHSRREQGQELAFSFGKAPPRPGQRSASSIRACCVLWVNTTCSPFAAALMPSMI